MRSAKGILRNILLIIIFIIVSCLLYLGGKKTFASSNLKSSAITISESNKNSSKVDISRGFADIVEPLMPAVVNIYTVQYRKHKKYSGRNSNIFNDDMFKNFKDLFEQFDLPFDLEDVYSNPKATSLGSGFIIDSSGLIVTNHHVISMNGDMADEIHVKLTNNKEYKAKIVGSDEKTDLALLQIDAEEKLPFVEFGNSKHARTGDWVIAIGNPFGLGGTVTSGIISSNSRDIDLEGSNIVDDYIQTDTAINRGNSGGPMFNIYGKVIGVNRVIISPSGANAGIGFAIPSSTAAPIIEKLRTHGKIKRGKIGVSIQEINDEMANALGLENSSGVLVVGNIKKGAAAEKAGIKSGDVIIEFNGSKIKNIRSLHIAVADAPLNKELQVVIIRDNKKHKLPLTILDNSEDQALNDKTNQNKLATSEEFIMAGIKFANIDSNLRRFYSLDKDTKGVVVVDAKQKSKGHKPYLRKGDVIVAMNNSPLGNVGDMKKIYQKALDSKKKYVMVLAQSVNKRKNSITSIYVTLPVKSDSKK